MPITKTTIQSSQKIEVINVTEQLAQLISHIQDGLALLSTPHTTAALILSEDDDELRADLIRTAEQLFANLRPFKHNRNNNPNTEAHLFSSIAGTSLTIGIEQGKLALGTYQNILFVELDGPKRREIHCKIISG